MGGEMAKGLRFGGGGSRICGVKLSLIFLWGLGIGGQLGCRQVGDGGYHGDVAVS